MPCLDEFKQDLREHFKTGVPDANIHSVAGNAESQTESVAVTARVVASWKIIVG